MFEALAFLIFASGIWYVIIWSVRNDDRVPPDSKKGRFGLRQMRRPSGKDQASTTDQRK
ncbi:hypothetical protein [Govanella unica]|uniref:Uncharacterized protein n=1 Tax=Govanella unica TaxID=2975056 RepID=A0A9X3TXN3_9PROT|nr:hypothetical protein [Govania unica]MDA5193589.1 hypothetical protein [Govania unica]